MYTKLYKYITEFWKTPADFIKFCDDLATRLTYSKSPFSKVQWTYYNLETILTTWYNFYRNILTLYTDITNFQYKFTIIYFDNLYDLWLKTEMLADDEIINKIRVASTRGAIKSGGTTSTSSNILTPSASEATYNDDNKLSWTNGDNINDKSLQYHQMETTGDDYLISEDLKRIYLLPNYQVLKTFIYKFYSLFKTVEPVSITNYL